MPASLKIQVEKKIEEILIEMRAKGHPILSGLSVSDISLLSSECIVEETFFLNHNPEFKNGSMIMSTRQLYKVKEKSLFEEIISAINFPAPEINRFFKLGVVILGLCLKEFPRYTSLRFEQRRGISVYFTHILLQKNYMEFNISDIERAKYMAKDPDTDRVFEIGNSKWGLNNFAEAKNGQGATFLDIKDSESWADASERGLPACCSYAFMREFDNILGKYYNWYAVEELALNPPKGWRVPSKVDFENLLEWTKNDGLSLKPEDQLLNKSVITNTRGFVALLGGYLYSDGGGFDYFGSSGCFWSAVDNAPNDDNAFYLFLGSHGRSVNLASQNKGLGFNLRLIQDTETMKTPDLVSIPLSTDEIGQPTAKIDISSYSSNATGFSWGDAVFSNSGTVGIILCWTGSMLSQFVLNKYGSSDWWGLVIPPVMLLSLGLIFSGAGAIIARFWLKEDYDGIWEILFVCLELSAFSLYAVPIIVIAVLTDWSWMLRIIYTIGEWSTTTWKLGLYINIASWLVLGQYSGKNFRRYIRENHVILAILLGCITFIIAILGVATN